MAFFIVKSLHWTGYSKLSATAACCMTVKTLALSVLFLAAKKLLATTSLPSSNVLGVKWHLKVFSFYVLDDPVEKKTLWFIYKDMILGFVGLFTPVLYFSHMHLGSKLRSMVRQLHTPRCACFDLYDDPTRQQLVTIRHFIQSYWT